MKPISTKAVPAKNAITQKQINGLFYSENDKQLFWIPNYYTNGSGGLTQLRKNLKEGESVLRAFVPKGEIGCSEILKSSRYKSMWYFSIDCDTCPKEAFKLGKDWTMFGWIQN